MLFFFGPNFNSISINNKIKMEKTIKLRQILTQNGFPVGRLISHSKSLYITNNPNHLVLFNANLCTLSEGKIWFGDLDLTLDSFKLKEIASEIGEDLFVLRESDARFNETEINETLILEKSIARISI
jgi:hypothetical protein